MAVFHDIVLAYIKINIISVMSYTCAICMIIQDFHCEI